MLLEWPENAVGALTAPDLRLELEATGLDDRRRLRVRAQTEAGRQCLARMTSTPAVPEA